MGDSQALPPAIVLANELGALLEQGRKRLVEWNDLMDRAATDSYDDFNARLAARDAMRAWTANMKVTLDERLGTGVRARVNFAATGGVPLGSSERGEAQARLIALHRLIGQLLEAANHVSG